MISAQRAARSRALLDQRFQAFEPAHSYTPPAQGWIRAVREALGMTAEQLAKRLKVTQPTVAGLERSEQRGSIELATLRRVAAALDCQVVYALVPNQPLEKTVRERARAFAKRRLEPIEHSMMLEDQAVPADADERLEELLRETTPRLFWE